MALVKCHECGTEISTEAKTCPKCGAKVKKEIGGGTVLLIAIATLVGAFAILGDGTPSAPQAAQTPEQKAQQAAEDKRYAVAATAARLLRESMRDPESLKIDSLRVNQDANIVCAEYRARNGFGGMNREIVVVTQDGSSQSAANWNKHCTQPLFDMLWAAR